MSEKTYALAIRDTIAQEMRRDEKVFIMGEDVEHTIRNVGVLAAEGMRETDRVILKIMTE